MEQATVLTVESKIYTPNEEILSSFGVLQNTISRTLFNELAHNEDLKFTEAQRRYSRKFGIPVRIFKSVWKDVNGKIKSITSNNKNRISYLEDKVKEIKNKIKDLKKVKKQTVKFLKHKHVIYNKLEKFVNRLKNAKLGKVKSVWGSKSYYKKQWNIDHDEWKQEWNRKRNHYIYLIGSKDESFGNQLCQLQALNKLVLRLPKSFEQKNLELNVNFDHKKKIYDYLKSAIANNQALTYRIFQRENGNWYVQISFIIANECTRQSSNIGIDINYDYFATCTIKEDGNPIDFTDYKFDSKSTTNQNKEQIIKIARTIVSEAKNKNKNIIIEKLDLQTLKNKDHGKNVNYKIGMILYGKFIQYLKSCAVKNSVLVIDVNPAYTSIIGKFKYADKLGRCVHQCASYVIARRGNRYKEKVPSKLGSLLHSGEKVNHHWSQWNKLNKRITTVLNNDTLHEFFKNLGKCTHDSKALILN